MSELSEVEKLKQQRREANAAKRAAGEAVSTDGPGDSVAQDDTAPSAPAVSTASRGPAEQLSNAEAKLEALMTESSELKALIPDVADADALDAAAKRQAAVSAGVGALTALMDEIDLGEIEDDEARTAARVRRKVINKRCALASSGDVEVDGDLAAAAQEIKKAIVAKRATVGAK